jgi:hypothetical protein
MSGIDPFYHLFPVIVFPVIGLARHRRRPGAMIENHMQGYRSIMRVGLRIGIGALHQ